MVKPARCRKPARVSMLVRFAPMPCKSSTAPPPGLPGANHARITLPDRLGKFTVRAWTPRLAGAFPTVLRAGRAKRQAWVPPIRNIAVARTRISRCAEDSVSSIMQLKHEPFREVWCLKRQVRHGDDTRSARVFFGEAYLPAPPFHAARNSPGTPSFCSSAWSRSRRQGWATSMRIRCRWSTTRPQSTASRRSSRRKTAPSRRAAARFC